MKTKKLTTENYEELAATFFDFSSPFRDFKGEMESHIGHYIVMNDQYQYHYQTEESLLANCKFGTTDISGWLWLAPLRDDGPSVRARKITIWNTEEFAKLYPNMDYDFYNWCGEDYMLIDDFGTPIKIISGYEFRRQYDYIGIDDWREVRAVV